MIVVACSPFCITVGEEERTFVYHFVEGGCICDVGFGKIGVGGFFFTFVDLGAGATVFRNDFREFMSTLDISVSVAVASFTEANVKTTCHYVKLG